MKKVKGQVIWFHIKILLILIIQENLEKSSAQPRMDLIKKKLFRLWKQD